MKETAHQKTLSKSILSQKGFAVVELVVLTIVVLIVGAGIYLTLQNKPASHQSAPAQLTPQYSEISHLRIGTLGGPGQDGIKKFFEQSEIDTPSLTITSLVFEGLTQRNSDFNLVPLLAQSWTNPNNTTWVFKLRRGVKFQNGKVFNADDVVYSYNYYRNNADKLSSAFTVGFKNIEKIDDYTVKVTTVKVTPTFLNKISFLFIMPKGYAEKVSSNPNMVANGTGPYKVSSFKILDDSDKENVVRELTLVRNNDYHSNKPKIKKVTYYFNTDDAVRLAKLKNNELDLIDYPPVDGLASLQKDARFRVVKNSDPYVFMLFMDQSSGKTLRVDGNINNPFNKLKVRQAIYHAIDANQIVKQAVNGLGVVPSSVISKSYFGANPSIKRLSYDPSLAKKLLAEAGYPNGFTVVLDSPHPRITTSANVVAEQLKKVGINASVATRYHKNKDFFQKKLSFYMIGWAPSGGDGAEALSILFASPSAKNPKLGSLNFSKYSNPKINTILQEVNNTTDQKKRKALLQEAFKIISDDVVAIPLYQEVVPYALKSNLVWKPRIDNTLSPLDVMGMKK